MSAEKYLDLMNKQRKEIEEFPIAYAFNKEQLKEALEKLNADISECCTYMDIGDVMRKKDVPAFKEMLRRHKQETYELLKDKEAAYEAFLYEMDNHEYAINWDGDGDVLGCFCLDVKLLKQMGLVDAYNMARREHMRHAREWDMI